MDKSIKKAILSEYKKKELEKLSQSEDSVWADFARNRLGLKSDRLSLERLENTPDDNLLEAITRKINEFVEVKYKSDPMRYKRSDNVIRELNESLRAIHFTRVFEMYVQAGDTDKFLTEAASFEVTEVVNGYRLLGFENLAEKICQRRTKEIQHELNDQEEVDAAKVKFIRGHVSEFELD